jgi:hypothetical protein
MTTIELDFKGAFIEARFPLEDHQQSGIYIVYAGKHNSVDEYSVRDILYIGESKNVSLRLAPKEDPKEGLKHDHYQDWINNLEPGEVLVFIIADVDSNVRERAEAALIYHHYNYRGLKLPCNEKNKESFDYTETCVTLSGKYRILDNDFIVEKSIAPIS